MYRLKALCAALLLALALMLPGRALAQTPEASPTPQASPTPVSPAKQVPGIDLSVIRAIPVQDAGRYKPLDTVARENVDLVTGKEVFEGWDPMELMLSWVVKPEWWRTQPIVVVNQKQLKKDLGLNPDQKYFSVTELQNNFKLGQIIQKAAQKARTEEKLTDEEKAANDAATQVGTFRSVISGEVFTIIPHPTDPTAHWLSIGQLMEGDQTDLDGYTADQLQPAMNAFRDTMVAYNNGDTTAFRTASDKLATTLASLPKSADIYPSASKMAMEVEYNRLDPFRWSWILFLTAFLILLSTAGLANKSTYLVGMIAYATAVGMTIYGFYLRCSIAGRPPVTNMYESIIWVSFGATMFAFVFEMIYKARRFALAASAVGTIGFVLADYLPIPGQTISPLAPVLRNNMWLTIHVLTITLSYAAFFLTWGLGHMSLWNYLKDPSNKKVIAPTNRYIYKAMQVGVLLVAAGTILGGVWANYSWGRFWGWDPKEVWALIVLLSYLVVLHGRYAGWLHDFGTSVSAIVCFLTVIMAWYGVNFVLGVGLHSYGFGTGGYQYMMSAVLADLAFVAFVAKRYGDWKLKNRPAADSGSGTEE
ncbi:MAG: cytochrome c biogenesis protein [Candidatus Xenobia bacterium]